MRLAALLFIYWAVVGIAWADEAAPTIDEVSGERMLLLHSDDDWRIFSITVASGDTLADHASGPRAIITLTDLKIQVLGGETEPMSVPPWQAMWLTNTFSRGFENIGDTALQYLVIEARDPEIEAEDIDHGCSAREPLLANSVLSICRIEGRGSGTKVELDRPSWLYSREPILAGSDEYHLALDAGIHSLLPSESPVVLVSFHSR